MNFLFGSVYRGIAAIQLMALTGAFTAGGTLRAEDWPQFLGPHRNGAASGEQIATTFPKEGPQKIWQKKVGQGFSSPIVVSNRVVICHRVGNEELAECLESVTGKTIWTA